MGMQNRPRQPAGTSSGGQFAPGHRLEQSGGAGLTRPLDYREAELLEAGWKQVDASSGGGRAFVSPVERSGESIGDIEYGEAQEVTVAYIERGGDRVDRLRRDRLAFAVVPDDPDFDPEDPDERPPSKVLMIDGRCESWLATDVESEPDDVPYGGEIKALDDLDGWAGTGDVRSRPNPFEGLTWGDESEIEAAATKAIRGYAAAYAKEAAYAAAMSAG